MHKRSPQLDWQVCQSDVEWETVSQAREPRVLLQSSAIRRFLPFGIGLVLLMAAGGLRWHSVQRERANVAAAIGRTVEVEAATDRESQVAAMSSVAPMTGVQPQVQLEAQALTALAETPPDGGAVTSLHYLASDVAVVEVTLPATSDQPALRQTRVYRQSGSDWVRITPAAAYWGAPLQWEAEHLVFHYYADDILAVAPVAAQLDARYAELHRLFLGEPPRRPLTVVVDPAQAPGKLATRASSAEPLVLASPGVYLAPETISDTGLLAQLVVLALIDDLKAQVLGRYDDAGDSEVYVQKLRVAQLLDGIRLWQVWQGDLPLAAWREPVVQWVFSDARPWLPEPSEVTPSFRSGFCAMHRLWMTTPLLLRLPLTCRDGWDTQRDLAWRLAYEPPLRLTHFPLVTLPMLMQDMQMGQSVWGHPAAAVALATVMDYAAATYGPERIPVLIAEASQYEYWATLIPAVFGVSANEFEAGWRAYLATSYDVDVSTFAPPQ
jgi:hypothetical protein